MHGFTTHNQSCVFLKPKYFQNKYPTCRCISNNDSHALTHFWLWDMWTYRIFRFKDTRSLQFSTHRYINIHLILAWTKTLIKIMNRNNDKFFFRDYASKVMGFKQEWKLLGQLWFEYKMLHVGYFVNVLVPSLFLIFWEMMNTLRGWT